MVVIAAIAAVAVSATGASSAKNTKASAAAKNQGTVIDGTLINGSLPPNGKPAHGGTITIGQITGQTPTGINPIIAGAQCSTQTFSFVSSMYMPLYYGPTGATPAINQALSPATAPVYTGHDTTVTIHIKPGLKWSDGKPVDAADVAFWYYVMKAGTNESPANWCQYASPTEFPYNVKSLTYSGNTLVFHLTHPVNPTWFTDNQLQDTNGGAYPLPASDWDVVNGKTLSDWASNPTDAKAIFDNLNTLGTNLADFTNPLWKVVDGPYKLANFNTTNSSYELTPNHSYGLSPKPSANIQVNTYTSSSAQLDALESGSLDIGGLDAATQLGAIGTLKSHGFSVYGGPGWGWFGGFINFKDETNHFRQVIGRPYMRGVFAELINQAAIVKNVYHGWAVAAYGPVASYPQSPYVPSNVTSPTWPYNPAKAVATLKANGWHVVPGGQTTCAHAGSRKGECGKGIPKGTPIKFVWANVPESTAATGVEESAAFASVAKRSAGINIQFQSKPFNFLTSDYNDQSPSAKPYYNDWGVNNYGGIFVDYYPTQNGVMNTTGALNVGYYADPYANKLMDKSIVSPSTKAIAKEVAYFAKSQPVLYFPVQDNIVVWSHKIGGTTDGMLELTQQTTNPSLFWVNK